MTQAESLDDFHDLGPWTAVGSGLAALTIRPDRGARGAAMRLDFDFKGGGGFVIARRALSRVLPERYVIRFDIHGNAPANRIELKLSDPSGRNVWWHKIEALEVTHSPRTVRIRSSEIEFAWGPAGGGTLTELGFIELAIVAPPGGEGRVWIEALQIEDQTYRGTPRASASSAAPGHGPDALFAAPADRLASGGWRSADASPAWLRIDFQAEREYGGLVLHWEAGRRARDFDVLTSDDGHSFELRQAVRDADAARNDLYLPATRARYLELRLHAPVSEQGFGLRQLEIKPFDFSRSLPAFFHALAAEAPRGNYPRYLSHQQSYWTPVAQPSGAPSALMNEEGMVEVDKGGFSLEPSLFADGALWTWADAEISHTLQDGDLPIPSSVWRSQRRQLRLETTAFAAPLSGEPALFIRYRVHNDAERARRIALYAAIRPFQVTPPWQAHAGLGGVRSIQSLRHEDAVVWVDERKAILAPGTPFGFGAASFAQGNVLDALRAGALPQRGQVRDDFGYASGALEFALDVPASAAQDVYVIVPFGAERAALQPLLNGLREPAQGAALGPAAFTNACAQWRAKLDAVGLELPGMASEISAAFRTALAHVLINRDGPALQPGPRRYTRAWIRDGATMAAALLRTGCPQEACAFIRWYACFQAQDGNVPCCVDERGPDWLVEHDSHGELIFTVAECYRFTRDRELLNALWPAVLKAVNYIEALRATRLTEPYTRGELRARYGLLPESASHEGYLAHPVHAYWDDFWAIRGLRDAAMLADAVGEGAQAQRIGQLRDAFRVTLADSIAETIATRKLDFLPGSVEWADFDATAIANVALLDETHALPRAALDRTFDKYLELFRNRLSSTDWGNYTPYEIRSVNALIALGRRADALEVANFLMADRRPRAWNQWPEIAWREPQSPGHIGDVPHTWIGAEYVLTVRSMLVFELEHERALVIGAGIAASWLHDGAVTARGLPTYYGTLDLRIVQVALSTIEVQLGGSIEPGVQLRVRPPLPGPLRSARVDGQPHAFEADGVTVDRVPATIVLQT